MKKPLLPFIFLYFIFALFWEIRGGHAQTPQICLVSVDTAIGKNVVVWEKSLYPANSYKIYKEVSLNNYAVIDTVSYNNLSAYYDYSSDPKTKSERYKISAVDSLGNESALSDSAKTMHLSVNLGISNEINMIWEPYEGIFDSVFYIYRSASPLYQMTLIDSIPSALTWYVDWSYPPADSLCYLIAVRHPTGCTATNPPTFFEYSFSNIACIDNPLISGVEYSEKEKIEIAIDKNNRTLTVFSGGENYAIQIFNALGQIVFETTGVSGNSITFKNLQTGIYFYKIITGDSYSLRGKFLLSAY